MSTRLISSSFLVERIVALNCFGCPLTSRESHIRAMRYEAQLENTAKQLSNFIPVVFGL